MPKKHFISKAQPALSEEHRQLRAQIDQTRDTIEAVNNHFEQEVDPMLIDCYIYELKAAQLRYQFLLRRFKRLEPSAGTKTESNTPQQAAGQQTCSAADLRGI